MKFGILFSPHWPEGRSQQLVYQQVIDHIVAAEDLGYWSAWVTEHHFAADPNYKPFGLNGPFPAYDLIVDPLAFLSYAAAVTKTIRLGTGVLVLHYDDPLRVAERAAMLDVMSGGRLELGLGRGGGVKEPAAWKAPKDTLANQDKFFEAIDVMRAAWTGKAFKHEGDYFTYPEVIVVPTPLQDPLPVYLSNRNPRSIDYAAKHDMSYVAVTSAWGLAGVESHNAFHDRFVAGATEQGRDLSTCDYPQTLYAYIAPTDAEAEEVAFEAIQRRDAFAEGHYESRRHAGGTSSPLDVPVAHQAVRLSFEDQFKGQLDTNLIGSPKTVAEKLRAVRERIPSFNYLLLIIGAGAAPYAFDRRSMELFAREVAPKFKDL
jgi:alkanesulfonate monooxygenase SsuD/methylene tetrahydromethanopterin reductase-like flavin-dependent oxidoreductase (luciferase family)